MFSLPPPNNGTDLEGLTDENPIRLEDTASDEFDQMLSIFYPS